MLIGGQEKMKCDFCQRKCDGIITLKDRNISKKDGSDVILCSECLNYYTNGEYDKIKVPKGKPKRTGGVK